MSMRMIGVLGKSETLADAIAAGEQLTFVLPDGRRTTEMAFATSEPSKFEKVWAVGAFRYRYAFWNTRAYCAPHPQYTPDEVKNLVNFVLGIGTIESLWWIEDEKKTGLYSNYGLLVNLSSGALDTIFLYENGQFRPSQFHYIKD